MTVSLCVREPYRADGDRHHRFGGVVAAPVAGVGALTPVVSTDGAIAMGGHVDERFGERLQEYLADGVAVDDAVSVLLSTDDASTRRGRQLHGVGSTASVAVTGDDCVAAAHRDGDHYTAAGTHLPSEEVLAVIADQYTGSAFGDRPLADRLIDALSAATEIGIDSRRGVDADNETADQTDADSGGSLTVGSAAVRVVTTESTDYRRCYNDLRVDASESPVADLRTTYAAAMLGYEQMVDAYPTPADPHPDA
jgi:Uncharacterized conserved protein